MAKQVIINLPVKNMEKSKEFFSKLGLMIKPELSDEHAACFIIEENILLALLPDAHFKDITKHDVADASKTNEVLVALSMHDRGEVDEFVNKALGAGGTELHDPQDHGWIYGRSFADLDGHQWNVYHMDMAKMPR